ncbi:MAG: nucleoside monophosphate kinase [Candidatus Saccharibacteria bacterium]
MEDIKLWLKNGSINFFGKPFAGKDTCADSLAKLLGASVIGGGDILRNNSAHASTQAKVEDGSLAPSDEYLSIVLPYFAQSEFANKPLVLSSVGRWHGEEPGVLKATDKSGHPLKVVIFIDIDESETRQRWQAAQKLADRGQRKDDAKHVLDKRLEEFANKTMPVLDFYRQKGILIEVNGRQSRQAVLQEVINKLAKFINKK